MAAVTGAEARMTWGEALARLRGAQKAAKGVSLYSRFVNRPAGRVLAATSYAARLTPNQVTLVSAAFSFAAVAAIALTPPSWAARGAHMGGAGRRVRLRLRRRAAGPAARRRQPAGEWLDHVVDCAKTTGLHIAVLVAFHRHPEFFGVGGSELWLLLPLGFLTAAIVTFFGGLLTEQLKPRRHRAAPRPRRRRCARWRCCPSTTGSSARCSSCSAAASCSCEYGLLGAAAALYLPLFLAKWFRELDRAAGPSGSAESARAGRG